MCGFEMDMVISFILVLDVCQNWVFRISPDLTSTRDSSHGRAFMAWSVTTDHTVNPYERSWIIHNEVHVRGVGQVHGRIPGNDRQAVPRLKVWIAHFSITTIGVCEIVEPHLQ